MKFLNKVVNIPEGSEKPLAPYSPNLETGTLVTCGVEAGKRQALINLSAILEAARSSLKHVLKGTANFKEIDDYVNGNRVYAEFFSENPPAGAIVQGSLPAKASIEFDAFSVISQL